MGASREYYNGKAACRNNYRMQCKGKVFSLYVAEKEENL